MYVKSVVPAMVMAMALVGCGGPSTVELPASEAAIVVPADSKASESADPVSTWRLYKVERGVEIYGVDRAGTVERVVGINTTQDGRVVISSSYPEGATLEVGQDGKVLANDFAHAGLARASLDRLSHAIGEYEAAQDGRSLQSWGDFSCTRALLYYTAACGGVALAAETIVGAALAGVACLAAYSDVLCHCLDEQYYC